MQIQGAQFVREAQAGEIWLLDGELGSGKTCFVQAIARELKIAEPVTSPTFNIVAEYPLTESKFKKLVHADLYRLSDQQAATDPAVQAIRDDAEGKLTMIEWGNRWPKGWKYTGRIKFNYGKQEDQRIIMIKRNNDE